MTLLPFGSKGEIPDGSSLSLLGKSMPGFVESVAPGPGISVSASTGNVSIINTGVTRLTAGAGIALSGNTGNITITSVAPPSGGTVTSIKTGPGLTGGPITSTGTISLDGTGIAPGTYTNPTLTVDSYGRVTFVTNGLAVKQVSGIGPVHVTPGTTPVVSVANASIAGPGIVQLTDSVTCSSSHLAATATAVKNAFDFAVGALPKSTYSSAGTLVTATAASNPVALPPGKDGDLLTVCSACAATGGLTWKTPLGLSGEFTIGGTQVILQDGLIVEVRN